ncbi:high-affinity lysophosphatidic acid receptor [Lingula anatina]|uniref:High-affinity lysophosphatidic acid receptor n=1 Tax=Lingula anatina TaxID=7574 RepID=A0A1S3HGK5_LINAN|nr:high-affinity lysophosphatidic acid receptor [Lingula anatina]XP_013385200.1 high-affinity lysophosphatidic acid receptor [Lingula anatina]|eukprot:XP_013385199.1 high-affinity lysophosphatidic acid receptor [Lingula anatina]
MSENTTFGFDFVSINGTSLRLNTSCRNNLDDGCDTCTLMFSAEWQVVSTILIALTMCVSIAGNSIVCVIVCRKPSMRSAINLLLANLAFSNILLSVFCMPFSILQLFTYHVPEKYYIYLTIGFLQTLWVSESMSVLFAISIDRYMIIVRRKDHLNPYRAKVIITFTWCYSLIISFPPLVGFGRYIFHETDYCTSVEIYDAKDIFYTFLLNLLVFIVPTFIMAYAYFRIVRAVRQNLARIQSQPNHSCDSMASRGSPHVTQFGSTTINKISVDVSFKTRAFKTILVLYVVFVICWIPYSISNIIWHFIPKELHAGSIILWIAYFNCALNPVIYCLRIKKFREACQDLLPNMNCPDLPKLSRRAQRRINPSALYRYSPDIQSGSYPDI